MRIALDFDGTYTRDPALWDVFLGAAFSNGHEVVIVTMRRPDELAGMASLIERLKVYFTCRRAKVKYMAEQGITIDIWIDDMPICLVLGADA